MSKFKNIYTRAAFGAFSLMNMRPSVSLQKLLPKPDLPGPRYSLVWCILYLYLRGSLSISCCWDPSVAGRRGWMILVTLRGAAAGWSPDTARAAQRGAELWSWILDNSSRTQPPLSTDNNSGASLQAAANFCTFAICHFFTYSKVKSWPTRPFCD